MAADRRDKGSRILRFLSPQSKMATGGRGVVSSNLPGHTPHSHWSCSAQGGDSCLPSRCSRRSMGPFFPVPWLTGHQPACQLALDNNEAPSTTEGRWGNWLGPSHPLLQNGPAGGFARLSHCKGRGCLFPPEAQHCAAPQSRCKY